MYIDVTKSIFIDTFKSVRPDNFNYSGLCALYEFLDEIDENCQLDVIAICCDFTQYDTIEEALKAYDCEDRDELENQTLIIDCNDESVIVQNC